MKAVDNQDKHRHIFVMMVDSGGARNYGIRDTRLRFFICRETQFTEYPERTPIFISRVMAFTLECSRSLNSASG